MSIATVNGLLAATALLALYGAAATPPEPLPRDLLTLRESLQRTEKLSARFTQTRRLAALRDVLITEGSIEYQKGGRLVWRTLRPAESELVIEGQHVTISYPGMGAAQTVDFSSEPGMGRVFATIRAVLQADLDSLLPMFTVTVARKAPLSVSLSPRTEELARTLRRIQLDFDRTLRLIRVVLNESDGDSTEIVFRDQKIQAAAH
jgi:outer membrane lipoprotein-sorting protein